MVDDGFLDRFPIWLLLLVTVVVVLLCVEIGYRLAGYQKNRAGENDAPVGGMVGATLGLLAFMLAFTFGMAASRFDDRRQVVLAEANAIGTTYLRAQTLAEPIATDTRNLLREYVEVRLEGARGGDISEAISKSEDLLNHLWSLAVAAAEKDRSPVAGLYIQSLNEVIDLHAKRIMVALRSRIPSAIWIGLYSLALLAMLAMGYHAGLTSTKRSIAVMALVLAFSVVVILIVDLDRPGEGLLRVSQQSMIDLQISMSVTRSQ